MAKRLRGLRRRLDGKVYGLRTSSSTKSGAKLLAGDLRRMGYSARVVPYRDGRGRRRYGVYTRGTVSRVIVGPAAVKRF